MDHFDFIIVGAGTAGCVLADRLSASGEHRVLVLEAGGSDKRFWIRTPLGYGRNFADPTINWKYQTLANPGLNGRTMYWPRGRVLGGSSSINALVYCRGSPEDFDDWRALGNVGWGWNDVKPYFENSERRVDAMGRVTGRGAMDVKDVTASLHAFRRNWLEAARELGYAVTDDFNGPEPVGFGSYCITVRDGRRRSAADAYLRPALERRNVHLETQAWVRKLRFDQGRAVGVDYVRGNETKFAAATREVLVCAGTVNSPQLLQLSGLGAGSTLQKHGVATLLDNPAVGGHLQDHLAVVYAYKSTQPTLNEQLHSTFGKLRAGLRYLLTRGGPLSLSVNQFGAFVAASPASVRADMQLYFNPVTYASGDSARRRIEVDAFPGFYLCFSAHPSDERGSNRYWQPGFSRAAGYRARLSVYQQRSG